MIYVHHHHRSLSYWVEVGPNDESIIVWYACTFPTGPVRTGWRPQGPKRHTHGVKDEIISLEVLGVVRSESIASWRWPWSGPSDVTRQHASGAEISTCLKSREML